MSDTARHHVPPFAPTPPTSLDALRRPLIKPEDTHCASNCQPCSACQAAQEKAVAAAAKTAADLGLRLSQLVEDAIADHVARIEAQQTELITTVLAGVLPHLANVSLRSALIDELAAAADPLRTAPLRLRKHPDLDLGDLPDTAAVKIEDDASVPMNMIKLREGDAVSTLDAGALIDACLARLGRPAANTQSHDLTPQSVEKAS